MKASQICLALLIVATAPRVLATNKVPTAGTTSAAAVFGANLPQLSTNPVPKSVFVVPDDSTQGRDPFFPTSVRLGVSTENTNSQDTATANLPLLLQGISGPTGRRLAIVNGRTLAENEEVELTFGPTRVVVRCVEIHTEHVVVEALGVRRELRLRTSN